MKRAEFLKRLFAGVAAAALAPTLLEQDVNALCDKYNYPIQKVREKFCVHFKVTTEALADEELFNAMVDSELRHLQATNLRLNDGPLTYPDKVEIGWVEDDFIYNMKTVLLTWYHV